MASTKRHSNEIQPALVDRNQQFRCDQNRNRHFPIPFLQQLQYLSPPWTCKGRYKPTWRAIIGTENSDLTRLTNSRTYEKSNTYLFGTLIAEVFQIWHPGLKETRAWAGKRAGRIS
jgi:hypothetical protein